MERRNQAQTTELKMDHNTIFRGCGDGQFIELAQRPEQPNYKIEVRIALRRALPKRDVVTKLIQNLKDNGMENIVLDPQNHHIIVDGIPFNYQYNAQSVLAEVRKFDDGAKILAENYFQVTS